MAMKWKNSSSATGESVTSISYQYPCTESFNVSAVCTGTALLSPTVWNPVYRVKKMDIATTNNYVWTKPYSSLTLLNYNSGGTASLTVNSHDDPAQTNGVKGTTGVASSSTPSAAAISILYYGDSVTISSTATNYKIRNNWNSSTQGTVVSTNAPYTYTFTGTMYKVTCCFLPDAQVMVSLDGTTRNIADIKPGDPVITYNKLTGELQETECYNIYTRVVPSMSLLEFEDGSSLTLTHDHPIYDNNLNEYSVNGQFGETIVNEEENRLKAINILKSDGTLKRITSLSYLEFNPEITTYDISLLQGTTLIVDGVVCKAAQDSQMENLEDEDIIFNNKKILSASATKASGGTAEPNACNTRCTTAISGACNVVCGTSTRSSLCCSISLSTCGVLCSDNISGATCINCSSSADSACDTICSTSASTMFC